MLNGHVGRVASEFSVLSGSGLLWRASVYVLVRHASSYSCVPRGIIVKTSILRMAARIRIQLREHRPNHPVVAVNKQHTLSDPAWSNV